ncbi:hypothetical protein OSC27_03670 [Microbacterium sp. STN6]|uniref:hypothetical protein n=1 Tax=Microbacterium sp. STN6 TaxID=2995588 RepID=UPI002260DA37|nr:hypothetical protein [Microbacterium sp. STN6]MCX7521373.1 hypothetical protein [Microbacterium sp. STN6]
MQYGNPNGFDLVLECSGHDGAALAATRIVRAGGEVVLIGAPWMRRTDATAHDVFTEVFHRYVTLRSGWEWQLPARPSPFVHGSMSDNVEQAMRWLRDGTIDVDALADRRSPADAQEVYNALAGGTAPFLTTVFDWTQPD